MNYANSEVIPEEKAMLKFSVVQYQYSNHTVYRGN